MIVATPAGAISAAIQAAYIDPSKLQQAQQIVVNHQGAPSTSGTTMPSRSGLEACLQQRAAPNGAGSGIGVAWGDPYVHLAPPRDLNAYLDMQRQSQDAQRLRQATTLEVRPMDYATTPYDSRAAMGSLRQHILMVTEDLKDSVENIRQLRTDLAGLAGFVSRLRDSVEELEAALGIEPKL